MRADRLPALSRAERSAAGPRLSLVSGPVSGGGGASSPVGSTTGFAWSPDGWREVFEEWRWWAGAGFALAVLGLAESFALPVQAADFAPASDGGWLLAVLAKLFEGGPLLRTVLAAAASGALLAVPWLWLQRSRAEQAAREQRRIERSFFVGASARKKWWPRS